MWLDLALFAAVGFAAQLVDGAIGMAYGLTATSVMLSMGIPPATASASVHAAEVFTTGASGLAHWRMGNARPQLLWRLVIPGVIGGALGACLLTAAPGETIRPFVNLYLLIMGGMILWRASKKYRLRTKPPRYIAPLGLGGGFLDAIGGGGWGPMVTSTLIGAGTNPRFAIGSVNLAEFFVTATISATFLATIGLELWPVILGLILGGVLAAPLAAYTVKWIPPRTMMIVVGIVIVALSARGLARSFFQGIVS